MSKIRLLPDTVANQIAAGEVVERPASVAKELLENSLDAGATHVEIDIEQGGKNLIRIRDDGEGMTRDDVLMAFERHATSKIRTADDLNTIHTFGFRGEALPSIASVARITVRSKLHDELAGTELEIEGGRIRHVRDTAWPGGTEISVRDLFFSVPARRKFLKSETTESFHVTNLVTHYALANPGKAFTLRNNGRETVRVVPTESLRDRAYQLFGENMLEELVEVTHADEGVVLCGFVSRPQQQRASRDAQYLFVNGRFVKDRVLSRAVGEAYRNIIPPGFFPSVMLFLEIDPEEVDVNVHPQKTEVRFRNANRVHDAVRDAVKAALGIQKPFAHFPGLGSDSEFPSPARTEPEPPPIPEVHRPPETVVPVSRPTPAVLDRNFKAEFAASRGERQPEDPSTDAPDASPSLPEPSPAHQPPAFFLSTSEAPPAQPDETAEAFARAARAGASAGKSVCSSRRVRRPEAATWGDPAEKPRGDLRILGQMHDSYIIAADARGLVVIDQHVAHERVLFERHLRRLTNRTTTSQALLIPETLDLTPAQAVAFERTAADLEANGFDVMRLSSRTVALRAVPADLSSEEARALLTELLDVVEQEHRSLELEHFQREIAAGLACRAAIKVNMTLTAEKMTWLIDELMKTENPTNCPHGRPVLLRFDMHEIERGFKRI